MNWRKKSVSLRIMSIYSYHISSYSFRGNYSFLNLEIVANSNTVFPQKVSAETILFWIWKFTCSNILIFAAETIQGRKLYDEILYLVATIFHFSEFLLRKLFKGGHYMRWGNTVFFSDRLILELMWNKSYSFVYSCLKIKISLYLQAGEINMRQFILHFCLYQFYWGQTLHYSNRCQNGCLRKWSKCKLGSSGSWSF